ncbi:unnamed protein product [Brassica oleracea var. botrytis]|uniref:(rape) hypothetical protein n=1 Tax=Brassica napus TaxID=3708 RepID=A0A816KIN0_BRANA|nr:unnamed protein product [Brassica napus]
MPFFSPICLQIWGFLFRWKQLALFWVRGMRFSGEQLVAVDVVPVTTERFLLAVVCLIKMKNLIRKPFKK